MDIFETVMFRIKEKIGHFVLSIREKNVYDDFIRLDIVYTWRQRERERK